MYLHSKLTVIYYVKIRGERVSIMNTIKSITMLTQLHHHT